MIACRIRISEGFHYAASGEGIVNMVTELPMKVSGPAGRALAGRSWCSKRRRDAEAQANNNQRGHKSHQALRGGVITFCTPFSALEWSQISASNTPELHQQTVMVPTQLAASLCL